MDEKKTKVLVSAEEQTQISRAVIAWLNTCEEKPRKVDFEFLGKSGGLCVSVVQAAYKTRQYINGGYQAQFQFQLVSRLIADNVDKRLEADEKLDKMGEWMEKNISTLALPTGIINARIRRDMAAAITARYDNNAEDHSTSMILTYEVI